MTLLGAFQAGIVYRACPGYHTLGFMTQTKKQIYSVPLPLTLDFSHKQQHGAEDNSSRSVHGDESEGSSVLFLNIWEKLGSGLGKVFPSAYLYSKTFSLLGADWSEFLLCQLRQSNPGLCCLCGEVPAAKFSLCLFHCKCWFPRRKQVSFQWVLGSINPTYHV